MKVTGDLHSAQAPQESASRLTVLDDYDDHIESFSYQDNEEIPTDVPTNTELICQCFILRRRRHLAAILEDWITERLETEGDEASHMLEQCGFATAEACEALDRGLRRLPNRFWCQESNANLISVGGLRTVIDASPAYWDAINKRAQWSRDTQRDTRMYPPPEPDEVVGADPGLAYSGVYDRKQCILLLELGVPVHFWPKTSGLDGKTEAVAQAVGVVESFSSDYIDG